MNEPNDSTTKSELKKVIDKHPVGTGTGAAVGLTAGALIGSAVGPVGAAVGAVVGTITGAAAGDTIAERIDSAAEDEYWRSNHHYQPYPAALDPYEEFSPAYRVGYGGYRRGLSFEDREAELRMEYEGSPQQVQAETKEETERSQQEEPVPSNVPGTMQYNMSTRRRSWDEAREPARAAYERIARRGSAGE